MWSIQDQIKLRKELKNFKQTGDSRCIYQKELDKVCLKTVCLFEAYGHFKDLIEEQLLIKHYVIKLLILLKIRIMMDIKVDLLQCSTNNLILRVKQLKMNLFLINN